MQAKEKLIFPLDVPDVEKAKYYINLLADYVGIFKVGLELFISAGPDIIRYINDKGGAEVFLDLKLHDIPATVRRAVGSVSSLGVKFATVHCGESHIMLEEAVKGSGGKVELLGVTVLTSVGRRDILTSGYREEFAGNMERLVVKRAQMAQDSGCSGVICSGLEVADIKAKTGNDFLAVTPGIRPEWSVTENDDQKRVTTPSNAIKKGADYLVIGRPIRDAKDPVAAAKKTVEEIDAALLKQ